MKVGTVFVWQNFPYGRDPRTIKDRWLIYLGETNPFETPIYILMVAATTKLNYYRTGEKRAMNTFIQFDAAPKSPFVCDSIVDFTTGFHGDTVIKSVFDNAIRDCEIVEKETLGEEKCRQIYNKVLNDVVLFKAKVPQKDYPLDLFHLFYLITDTHALVSN